MKVGVLVLNFGEPPEATLDQVVPFLERIFLANANLEDLPDLEARRARSRELAERRAPGLIEEYRAMGPSPLNEQAAAQAAALERALARRGHPAKCYSAFQFTEPLISEAVAMAKGDGVELLVGLPMYPLCGPSTNVAALNDVQAALESLEWSVPFHAFSDWHRHPQYLQLRAEAIRRTYDGAGLRPDDPETHLVFSAHGTPRKYLDEGSRYVEYVEEFCADLARVLEVERTHLGYQNHTNRGIEWTQPDVEAVVPNINARRVVVDPVSFMHEQSETLAELDQELREVAEAAGLEFLRVPIPHDDPRFAELLADLIVPFITGRPEDETLQPAPCRCRPSENTVCLNARPRNQAAPFPGMERASS